MRRRTMNTIPSILLIEDNPDHIFLTQRAIEDTWQDVRLYIAHDLSEARVMLNRLNSPAHFDVLLATIDPRNSERLARLCQLREFPALHRAIFVALVSSTRDQEMAHAANPPFNRIVLKPLRAETLRGIMLDTAL